MWGVKPSALKLASSSDHSPSCDDLHGLRQVTSPLRVSVLSSENAEVGKVLNSGPSTDSL